MTKRFGIPELQNLIGSEESLHGTLDALVKAGYLSSYEFCFKTDTCLLEIPKSAEIREVFEELYNKPQVKKKGSA